MISLDRAKKNKEYFLRQIEQCDEKLRLMEMGFCNCKIKLLKANFGKKDYLVCLRNFKVILRGELAQKIWLEELLP